MRPLDIGTELLSLLEFQVIWIRHDGKDDITISEIIENTQGTIIRYLLKITGYV